MRFKNLDVLVPVDFSEPSLRAVREAGEMVRALEGKITLLHVCSIPYIYATEFGLAASADVRLQGLTQELVESARARLTSAAVEELDGLDVDVVIREGSPSVEIAAQVEAGGHGLVFMGSRGRTGVRRALLGSVTERVLRRAEVPVVVTH